MPSSVPARVPSVAVPRTTLLALPIAAALLAGCGGDEGSPEQEVRAVLQTFATATEERDYATICDEVLAPSLLAGLREIGLPCEVALRNSFQEVRDPELTVGEVTVDGASATAKVRTAAAGQAPSTDTLRLERADGKWRVSALADGDEGAGEPTPTPTPDNPPGLDGG